MRGKLLWAELSVPSSDPGTVYIHVDWNESTLAAKVDGEYLFPYAIIFDEADDANLRVKEAWLAIVDTDQKIQDILPATGAGAGKGVTLSMLNKNLGAEAGGFQATGYKVRHGLRLKIKIEETGAAARTVSILVKYENSPPNFVRGVQNPTAFDAIGRLGPRSEGVIPLPGSPSVVIPNPAVGPQF